MEEAVVAAGRARGDLASFDEGDPDAPQDEVVGERATRPPAADDDDVERGGTALRLAHRARYPTRDPAGRGPESMVLAGVYSIQPKVRVTAFFQAAYSESTVAASMVGCHS